LIAGSLATHWEKGGFISALFLVLRTLAGTGFDRYLFLQYPGVRSRLVREALKLDLVLGILSR
jgi:hypothetical protein